MKVLYTKRTKPVYTSLPEETHALLKKVSKKYQVTMSFYIYSLLHKTLTKRGAKPPMLEYKFASPALKDLFHDRHKRKY